MPKCNRTLSSASEHQQRISELSLSSCVFCHICLFYIRCRAIIDMIYEYVIYRVFIKYCVFSKILKYSGLWPFPVFPRCQYVYTHQAGRKPALQADSGRVRKNHILRKKTQYLMNTLYIGTYIFFVFDVSRN